MLKLTILELKMSFTHFIYLRKDREKCIITYKLIKVITNEVQIDSN